MGSEPFGELVVIVAVRTLVYRNDENSGREHSEYWLATIGEILASNWSSQISCAQVSQVCIPAKMGLFVSS